MDQHDDRFRNGITWFVSRHRRAIEWAKRRDLAIDRWAAHLEPAEVGAADTVIGTLPVNLAAAVCRRGARYLHVSLEVPADRRGRELSVEELSQTAARLKEFRVTEIR